MRSSFFALALLAFAVTLVAAWSKEDQEIFRLRDEIAISEGPEVTFYDFLETTRSANQDEITRAYKKRSRVLHPDKVKQKILATSKEGAAPGTPPKLPSAAELRTAAKAASDRFARLGLVQKLLKGPERARYDHFLAHGFPKWKGSGYYYSRFRPGFGTVLAGLFVFVGGAGHYIVLAMNAARQREFVARYVAFARRATWGDALNVPGVDAAAAQGADTPPSADSDAEPMQPMNRRQRRMQDKDAKGGKPEKKAKAPKAPKAAPAATPAAAVTVPKKRVVAENGKVLVVDAVGNVYLEQRDDEGHMQEFLLDPNDLPPPTIRDTALVRLPLWLFAQTAGRLLPASATADEPLDSDSADDSEEPELVEKSGRSAAAKRVKSRRSSRK